MEPSAEQTPTRPLLRYHGGKWNLAPWIISHFPPHRSYVEPFGGAASVLLQKARCYSEVYNDIDGEIVNVFRVLRERGRELLQALELTPFAREEYRTSYGASDDPVERARRTIVRSFMGHGSNSINPSVKSGFRHLSNRSNTVAAMDWRHYPEQLGVIIDRLRGVTIEQRDACELIPIHDTIKTLYYVDPPYLPETRSESVRYHGYKHELTQAEHVRLAEILHQVKGMVILSGYPSDLYDKELYYDFQRSCRRTYADGALPRTEVLWASQNVDLNLLPL